MSSTISAGTTAGSSLAMAGDTSGSLQLQTNGTTTAVTIDTSQNVGIGTSSPTNKLTVNGGIDFSGTAFSGSGTGIWQQATNVLGFVTAGSTRAAIDASGNVGIGTTSPGSKLDVRSANVITDALGQVSIYANDFGINYGGSIGLGGAYNTALSAFTDYTQIAGRKENATSGDYAGYLAFATRVNSGAITERMRIDSSGNLLVGTTSVITGGKVNISGYDGAASQSGMVFKPSTATLTNYLIFYNSAAGLAGYINQTGTTTVSYGTSSDYRLKENVQPIPDALDRVLSLKPVIYSWKNTDGELGEGFLAHELQEVCPLAVTGTKDDINEDGSIKSQGVDYSKIVALLTASIQEQQALIIQLQADVAALKGVK